MYLAGISKTPESSTNITGLSKPSNDEDMDLTGVSKPRDEDMDLTEIPKKFRQGSQFEEIQVC